jgi:hypothetical protein
MDVFNNFLLHSENKCGLLESTVGVDVYSRTPDVDF